MDKRIFRFEQCDSRFYPYLQKVLNRLPREISEDILNNKGLEILGIEDFLTVYGCFRQFNGPVRDIVYLNEEILTRPEISIIHTIAHELAHYVAGKGKIGLHEKEAEDLLVSWGFNEEVEQVKYHKSISETEGYKVGYEWAKKQKEQELLDRFEQYYKEWDEDRLSDSRLEALFYEVDPMSIYSDMGMIGGPEESSESKPDEDTIMIDSYSLDKGVVWGIMAAVKEIILKRESCFIGKGKDKDKVEVLKTLEIIDHELSKLFVLRGYHEYFEEGWRLGIDQLSMGIDKLLQKIKKGLQK